MWCVPLSVPPRSERRFLRVCSPQEFLHQQRISARFRLYKYLPSGTELIFHHLLFIHNFEVMLMLVMWCAFSLSETIWKERTCMCALFCLEKYPGTTMCLPTFCHLTEKPTQPLHDRRSKSHEHRLMCCSSDRQTINRIRTFFWPGVFSSFLIATGAENTTKDTDTPESQEKCNKVVITYTHAPKSHGEDCMCSALWLAAMEGKDSARHETH